VSRESRIGSRMGFNTPSQDAGFLDSCLEEVGGTHASVVAGRMVFRMVISKVLGARAPVNEKLFLADLVFYPIGLHVNCFGSFLFDSIVGKAGGC
jgi:hypothetical protein